MTYKTYSIVEQTIGLIVGCMPILPAFFRRTKPNGQNLGKRSGRKSRREDFFEPQLLDRDNLELADLEYSGSPEPSGSVMMVSVTGGKS